MANYEWLTTPNKEQHEYIIGIDFGHGETSAAFCPIGWNLQDGELEGVKDIDFGNNSKVIPSAISITDDGRVYIGEAAFLPEILNKAKVNVCFKKRPENIDGEQEQLMIQYMRAVYQLICEKNNALFTNGNHIVCIAAPSGWSQETMLLYGQMAHKAGLPIFGCVSESRAAFIKAQQDVSSGLPQYINQGAIVFDMGSSTLDFTYLRENEVCDYGYDCGASRVEKLIYSGLREDNEDIVSFEQQHPHLVAKLLFEARSAKEGVYFHPETRFKRTVNFEDIVDDEEFEDAKMKFIYEPGELNRTLQSNGYIDEIRRAMIDFKQNHINGKPIYVAFLTGGASRMDFIKPLVSECWGLPEEKIYRDQDPSLTISRGTADAGRMIARNQDESEEQVSSVDEQIEHWRNNVIPNLKDEDWYFVKANVIHYLVWTIWAGLYDGSNTYTQTSGEYSMLEWYNVVRETTNEYDEKGLSHFIEISTKNYNYLIDKFKTEVDENFGHICKLSESSTLAPRFSNKLKKQLERIWEEAQSMSLGLNPSLFADVTQTPALSITEEIARLIVNDWCEELLNGTLNYLTERSFVDKLFFDVPQDRVRAGAAWSKNLGNSTRRTIWNSLNLNLDFATWEDGHYSYFDIAGQTANKYVETAIIRIRDIQKEIDKYVEMCNTTLLSYFNSYVAELKSKL